MAFGALAGSAVAVTAGPAAAQTPDTWTDAEPTPWLETLAIFAGIPAGLFLLITLLALAPSLIRHGGYQPGMAWWSAPQWFGAEPVLIDPSETSRPARDHHVEPARKVGGVGARW